MPLLRGDLARVATVARSGLEVFAHNIETVERLTPVVRDRRVVELRRAVLEAHERRVECEVAVRQEGGAEDLRARERRRGLHALVRDDAVAVSYTHLTLPTKA